MTVDEWKVPNVLQKVSHILAYTQHASDADWSCLVETDVYFSPVNFRRFVRSRHLSPDARHWLGYTHMHSMLEEGMMVEPATGTCLSRAALRAAGREITSAKKRHYGTNSMQAWPPTEHGCDPLVTGIHSLLTPVINACMRAAHVYPPPPSLVHDHRGRMFFPNLPYNSNLSSFQPPARPAARPHRRFDWEYVIWKGREFLYAPCQGVNEVWVAEYPVMFHGHTTHDARHRVGNRSAWKRQNPSLRQVHDKMMSNNHRFGMW
mmetsp:Transcript_87125/g.198859  ORF Transcript_87125/g.198859 Transcript_87125/m.198859 type:complete len:262 (+) Transcript_87125:304-1089(+)